MKRTLLSLFSLFLLSWGMSANAQNAATADGIALSKNFGSVSSVKDGEIVIPVKLENSGTSKINNVTVTVTLDGRTAEYTVAPTSDNMVEIKVPAPSAAGMYDVAVSLDKVNGIENNSDVKTSTGKVVNLTRQVNRKVLFEEFTGLGCGWCPRGLVALEEAREKYGRDIVLISAHFDDPMKCREYNLIKENQLPSAHLDRRMKSIDPYFGTSNGATLFGIDEDIQKCAKIAPVAEVNVEAYIDGDKLYAKSDVKFLFSGSGNYAIAFVVTEDGVCNEKWSQLNNYSQFKGAGMPEEKDPKLAEWINADGHVKGYVYDDVAIVASGIKNGIDESMPKTFVEEESNIYEVEYDLKKLKSIKNRKNLNVCAFLFDRKDNTVVNANYMSFEHETAIEGVEADDENVVEAARYTVDGRMINTPEKGINIVKYSDGSVRKVVVR